MTKLLYTLHSFDTCFCCPFVNLIFQFLSTNYANKYGIVADQFYGHGRQPQDKRIIGPPRKKKKKKRISTVKLIFFFFFCCSVLCSNEEIPTWNFVMVEAAGVFWIRPSRRPVVRCPSSEVKNTARVTLTARCSKLGAVARNQLGGFLSVGTLTCTRRPNLAVIRGSCGLSKGH